MTGLFIHAHLCDSRLCSLIDRYFELRSTDTDPPTRLPDHARRDSRGSNEAHCIRSTMDGGAAVKVALAGSTPRACTNINTPYSRDQRYTDTRSKSASRFRAAFCSAHPTSAYGPELPIIQEYMCSLAVSSHCTSSILPLLTHVLHILTREYSRLRPPVLECAIVAG